jgi:hypothetical protein
MRLSCLHAPSVKTALRTSSSSLEAQVQPNRAGEFDRPGEGNLEFTNRGHTTNTTKYKIKNERVLNMELDQNLWVYADVSATLKSIETSDLTR